MDKELMDAAMVRAAELQVYFSHTRPCGELCFSICPTKARGENIAAGYTTSSAVMRGWMSSEGHRNNILNNTFKSIGIGCFAKDGTLYWVQLFSGSQLPATTKPADAAVSVEFPIDLI